MPQCCKTIHIDGSSKNFTIDTDSSSEKIIQYDFICSYSHDQPALPDLGIHDEYKAYTCKGDPTNSFASWIDEHENGYGFYMLRKDGRYSIGSPSLIPGQDPPR